MSKTIVIVKPSSKLCIWNGMARVIMVLWQCMKHLMKHRENYN